MKNIKLLTNIEKEFIVSPEKRDSYQKTVRNQYAYRIRLKLMQMIEDLQFAADHLPEDQQEQIFTQELFIPMIKAVVNPDRKGLVKNPNQFKKDVKFQRIYVKNKRLLNLSSSLIDIGRDSGVGLIPFDLANLVVASGKGERETALVQNIGKFI